VVDKIMPIRTLSRNADEKAAFLRMPAVVAHTGHGNILHADCVNNFQTVYELFERLHQTRIVKFFVYLTKFQNQYHFTEGAALFCPPLVENPEKEGS
jgi:hypothetical protein